MILQVSARLPGGQEMARFRTDRDRVSIGRSADCAWVLPDPGNQVSGRHAEIAWVQDSFYAIADTSTNGTAVNGERLAAPRRLASGDRVAIGPYELLVHIGDAAMPAAPVATVSTLSPALAAADPGPAGSPADALAKALADLLATRARQRGELGAKAPDPIAGNPFTTTDPLRALSALPPAQTAQAVTEAVRAIDKHNAAALMAMQEALRETLETLSPRAIAAAGGDEAALWRRYAAAWEGREKGGDFMTRFATAFAAQYDKL